MASTALSIMNVSLKHVRGFPQLCAVVVQALEPLGAEHARHLEVSPASYPFLSSSADTALWLEFCQHTLLYAPAVALQRPQQPEGQDGAAAAAPNPVILHSGLSQKQVECVAGNARQKAALVGEKLSNRKVSIPLNMPIHCASPP